MLSMAWSLAVTLLLPTVLSLAVLAVLALRETRARISRAKSTLDPAFFTRLIAAAPATARRRRARHSRPHAVKHVQIKSIAQAGDGKASTTDRIALRLTYMHGRAPPADLILKTTLLPPGMRLGGALLPRLVGGTAALLRPIGLDRVVFWAVNTYNFYFPHAPDAMYANEVKILATLSPELEAMGFVTPRVYGIEDDARRRAWSVLMEDLSGAHFPTALEALSVQRLATLLRSLAKLHGRFWESPRFRAGQGGDLAWVPTVHSGGMHQVFDAIGYGLIRDHVRRNPFEQELLAPLGMSVEALWAGLQRAEAVLATPPLTLCHGDAHIQNTYVRADGVPGMFDWQLTLRASWARDVAYLIGTALPTEVRRRHEKELVRAYLEELRRHGGKPPDEEDDAMKLYAQAMAWGLVIGWLICPPNNYGKEILSANVRRLVAACKDLGTFQILLG